MDAYARALVQGVRVMDERRHILEPLIRNEPIRGALNALFRNTFGAHAYNHLVPLMAHDLVRDMARLLLDDDKRSASFVNLVRKASEPALNAVLREKFGRIPDKWHENAEPIEGLTVEQSTAIRDAWREKDRDEFLASFDEGWATVLAARDTVLADERSTKICTLRDKYLAHYEMAPLGAEQEPFNVASLGLTFNDIFAYADQHMPAVFELCRVLTGNVFDVEGFSEAHRRYGKDMWAILSRVDAERE